VRLVPTAAAVTAALAIPGLVGAGDPHLQIQPRPSSPIVLESGGRRDTVVSLEVRNPGERSVRVDDLRILYLEGQTAVQTIESASSLFTEAGLLSDPRVEANATEVWSGLCLAPPTAGTDRVRLEFRLVERRGIRSSRATQTLDVPLRAPESPPAIALPFRGTWVVTQGHACGTNHRRSPLGSEFAWDLAAVDERATFGSPVLAPASGRVVFSGGTTADNPVSAEPLRRGLSATLRNPLWFFGNYVVIESGQVFVLLAHLRQGSVAVKAGDLVREGDVIAAVGNSGNTSVPHLHVQVMNRADPGDPAVEGIPAVFRNYMEVTSRGEASRRESVVRRVALGDPPVGAVLVGAPSAPR